MMGWFSDEYLQQLRDEQERYRRQSPGDWRLAADPMSVQRIENTLRMGQWQREGNVQAIAQYEAAQAALSLGGGKGAPAWANLYLSDEYLQVLLDEMVSYKQMYGADWETFVDPMVAKRINDGVDQWYRQRTRPKEGGKKGEREFIQDEPMLAALEHALRDPMPTPSLDDFKVGNRIGPRVSFNNPYQALGYVYGGLVGSIFGGEKGARIGATMGSMAGNVAFSGIPFSLSDRDEAVTDEGNGNPLWAEYAKYNGLCEVDPLGVQVSPSPITHAEAQQRIAMTEYKNLQNMDLDKRSWDDALVTFWQEMPPEMAFYLGYNQQDFQLAFEIWLNHRDAWNVVLDMWNPDIDPQVNNWWATETRKTKLANELNDVGNLNEMSKLVENLSTDLGTAAHDFQTNFGFVHQELTKIAAKDKPYAAFLADYVYETQLYNFVQGLPEEAREGFDVLALGRGLYETSEALVPGVWNTLGSIWKIGSLASTASPRVDIDQKTVEDLIWDSGILNRDEDLEHDLYSIADNLLSQDLYDFYAKVATATAGAYFGDDPLMMYYDKANEAYGQLKAIRDEYNAYTENGPNAVNARMSSEIRNNPFTFFADEDKVFDYGNQLADFSQRPKTTEEWLVDQIGQSLLEVGLQLGAHALGVGWLATGIGIVSTALWAKSIAQQVSEGDIEGAGANVAEMGFQELFLEPLIEYALTRTFSIDADPTYTGRYSGLLGGITTTPVWDQVMGTIAGQPWRNFNPIQFSQRIGGAFVSRFTQQWATDSSGNLNIGLRSFYLPYAEVPRNTGLLLPFQSAYTYPIDQPPLMNLDILSDSPFDLFRNTATKFWNFISGDKDARSVDSISIVPFKSEITDNVKAIPGFQPTVDWFENFIRSNKWGANLLHPTTGQMTEVDVELVGVFDPSKTGNEAFVGAWFGETQYVWSKKYVIKKSATLPIDPTGMIVTHYHPSGSTFSKQDVYTMLVRDIAELRIVGGEDAFSLRPKGNSDSVINLSDDERLGLRDKIYTEIHRIQREIETGNLLANQPIEITFTTVSGTYIFEYTSISN